MSRNSVERRGVPQEARAEGEERLVRSALWGEAEAGTRGEGAVWRTGEENERIVVEGYLVGEAPLKTSVLQAVEKPRAEGASNDARTKEGSPV
jgi:hypothetical protein